MVVSLGSNIDPERNLRAAVDRLAALGRLRAVSRVYASPAVGPPGQPEFLNAAALVETALTPLAVRDRLREIESSLGRVRTADRFAPRPIDLDLVLFDDLVLDAPPVRIPDPDLLERSYLAATAAELDPSFPHPETGETLGALAGRLASRAELIPRPDVSLSTEDNSAARRREGSTDDAGG